MIPTIQVKIEEESTNKSSFLKTKTNITSPNNPELSPDIKKNKMHTLKPLTVNFLEKEDNLSACSIDQSSKESKLIKPKFFKRFESSTKFKNSSISNESISKEFGSIAHISDYTNGLKSNSGSRVLQTSFKTLSYFHKPGKSLFREPATPLKSEKSHSNIMELMLRKNQMLSTNQSDEGHIHRKLAKYQGELSSFDQVHSPFRSYGMDSWILNNSNDNSSHLKTKFFINRFKNSKCKDFSFESCFGTKKNNIISNQPEKISKDINSKTKKILKNKKKFSKDIFSFIKSQIKEKRKKNIHRKIEIMNSYSIMFSRGFYLSQETRPKFFQSSLVSNSGKLLY